MIALQHEVGFQALPMVYSANTTVIGIGGIHGFVLFLFQEHKCLGRTLRA